MQRRYHADNTTPKGSNWVFVFGSNLAGRHGAGAAKVAHVNFGARYGLGSGPTGKSYAIPTKDKGLRTLGLGSVRQAVSDFLDYADENPTTQFFVTRVGCGLAGFQDSVIASLFCDAPANCSLPLPWKPFLESQI